jgi:hypothetical protein
MPNAPKPPEKAKPAKPVNPLPEEVDELDDPEAERDAWVDESDDDEMEDENLELDDLLAEDDPPLTFDINDEDDNPDILAEDDAWAEEAVDEPEVDDEHGSEILEDEFDDLLTEEIDFSTGELVVLPWRMTVTLPAFQQRVSAVLDVTLERSVWTTAGEPPAEELTTEIVVGPLAVDLKLIVQRGSQSLLRLGRDFLSGRVLVDSA